MGRGNIHDAEPTGRQRQSAQATDVLNLSGCQRTLMKGNFAVTLICRVSHQYRTKRNNGSLKCFIQIHFHIVIKNIFH